MPKKFKTVKTEDEINQLKKEEYEIHSFSEWTDNPESFSCLMVKQEDEEHKKED